MYNSFIKYQDREDLKYKITIFCVIHFFFFLSLSKTIFINFFYFIIILNLTDYTIPNSSPLKKNICTVPLTLNLLFVPGGTY